MIGLFSSPQNLAGFRLTATRNSLARFASFVLLVSVLGYLENAFATEPEPVKKGSAFVEVKLADINLIDQDGHPLNFAGQAVGDRIVAINFIYTTCSTVCPLSSAIFQQVQKKIGDRLGQDIWLISISLDPIADTPARLKEYAARFHAKPGWLWLTGSTSDVEHVLNGLGTTAANFTEHAPITFVGDGQRGTWVQFNTITGPEQIRSELERMSAARKNDSSPP